jgi:hypothetical protein
MRDGLLSVHEEGYASSPYGGGSYEAWCWELARDEEKQLYESGQYCFDANWVTNGAADGKKLRIDIPKEYGMHVWVKPSCLGSV